VAGLNWEGGAIGTAVWSGARLVDVLKAAGIPDNDPNIRHVHFEGADLGPDGLPYGTGCPKSRHLLCEAYKFTCLKKLYSVLLNCA
jgi:sulfite oxidase